MVGLIAHGKLNDILFFVCFFFSSRRRHTRSLCDWSSDVCSSDLLKSAIRDKNPVLFFEHVLLYNLKEELPSDEYLVPLDKADIVRPGKDVTILTYSRMRHHVLQIGRASCRERV